MSKTLIDIDNDLLTRSQQILGTATKKDTVNRALHEVVRRRAAEEFIELARGGAFDALLDRQTLDRQTLDRQTLDRQTLDGQTLDRQALDGQTTERACR